MRQDIIYIVHINKVAMMDMDSLNRDLWLFHLAFRQLVRLPDRLLAERGLSRIHHRILWVIGRSGELSVGELADRLEITRQALHQPMRQLRDASLLTSKPAESNRSIQLVSLTSPGKELEERLNALQRSHLEAAFGASGKGACKGWRDVMTLLSHVLLTPQAQEKRQRSKQEEA
jgi:DNA-binding MarR family transcriptional regulator